MLKKHIPRHRHALWLTQQFCTVSNIWPCVNGIPDSKTDPSMAFCVVPRYECMTDRWPLLCVRSDRTWGMLPFFHIATAWNANKYHFVPLLGERRLLYITGWWNWPGNYRLLVLTDGCLALPLYSMWLCFTHDPVFSLPKFTLIFLPREHTCPAEKTCVSQVSM